jgi:hypothetical protein
VHTQVAAEPDDASAVGHRALRGGVVGRVTVGAHAATLSAAAVPRAPTAVAAAGIGRQRSDIAT